MNQDSDDKLYRSLLYYTHTHTHQVLLKNVLNATVKIIFIKSQPLGTHFFNKLEEETEVHIKHLCCIPKYNGCQGKAFELQAELATFLWNTIST